MWKLALYGLLLIVGLVLSQVIPGEIDDAEDRADYFVAVQVITQVLLSFVMFRVGLSFELHKSKETAWDYLAAVVGAYVPWVAVALYIGFVLPPTDTSSDDQRWEQTWLLARFVAPSSAGVLLHMLTSANLKGSWLFNKAKAIAVFDDLDTIIWILLLRFALVGFQWGILVILIIYVVLLLLAWFQHKAWNLPASWPWVCLYACIITGVFQLLAWLIPSGVLEGNAIVIDVLLASFCLGTCLSDDGHGGPKEEEVALAIVCAFMFFVGLSIPPFFIPDNFNWGYVAGHVIAILLIMNLGKILGALVYIKDTSTKECLGLGIALGSRIEVAVGVIVVAVGMGVTGVCILVATFTVAVNLIISAVYVIIAKLLLGGKSDLKTAGPNIIV